MIDGLNEWDWNVGFANGIKQSNIVEVYTLNALADRHGFFGTVTKKQCRFRPIYRTT